MKAFWRWMAACLLVCALLSGTALAELWDMAGALDEAFSDLTDVRFTLSMQLDALPPYGENALAMMNAALRGMSLSASVGEETAVAFCVAGDPVAELRESVTPEGTSLVTPLLPNRTLTSAGSALEALLDAEEEQEPTFAFFRAIKEAEACYKALIDAIVPYATPKKANYNIKDVGLARWSVLARLTPEQGEELAPLIAQVLGCGMDEAYREKLRGIRCAKGFIVGVYQTQEGGDDLAVYLKGDLTFADGIKRTLSYQWAFGVDGKGRRVDTYKFIMKKAQSPKDDREINASCKRLISEAKSLVEGRCTAKVIDQGVITTETLSHSLAVNASDGARALEGSVEQTVKTTQDEKTQTVSTTVVPSLRLVASQGSGVLSGSVALSQKQGKNTTLSVTLLLDEDAETDFANAAGSGALFAVSDFSMPESSLSQNRAPEREEDYLVGKPPLGYKSHTAPKSPQTVRLDELDGEALADLTDELLQNMAGKLLAALARLPEENAAFLRDNLSDADYAAFQSLVEGL